MTGAALRVCYVVGYFYPLQSGAERQALEQGAELVRIGHTVHVITQAAFELPRDEVVRGIQVHRWVRPVRRGPLFGPTFVASVVRALRRLRGQIDIVHTHQALWEAVATGTARTWMRDLPTLVQPASSGFYGEAEELLRTRGARLLKKLILQNSGFAAISSDIEHQWRALGVPSSRMVRARSGVDTTRFHPGPSQHEATLLPRPRVVFIGRLHPQKNVGVLIDAWPKVRQSVAASLLLAGEGPDRAELEERIAANNVADSVQLTGSIEEPSDLLRAADLFVLPSVAEGMSNSLLEAMATGLPCLASDIGGNRDLIQDDVTGRLVQTAGVDPWADEIVRLLLERTHAKSLGLAALRLVEDHYALPKVVEDYVAIYKRLLAQSDWPPTG